jgi:hypothetical protein
VRLEAILQSIATIIDQDERYMERVKSIYSAYQHLLIPKRNDLEDNAQMQHAENDLMHFVRE